MFFQNSRILLLFPPDFGMYVAVKLIHRRSINTEEKANIVAAVCRAILHQDYLQKRINSSYSSNTGTIHTILQIVLVQNS